MKSRNYIAIGLFFIYSLMACKKDRIDYRDVWTGTYTGTRNDESWNLSNPVTYDTTYFYSFTVSKPSSGDSITINGTTIPITTDGTYYSSSSPGNYYDLRFVGDSCLIDYRSGGLGGYYLSRIRGKKE